MTTKIGRTSSLVLTLCGVLKDILLVIISMVYFKTPVTALQAFGYSIALGGLLYYKLGSEKIKELSNQANRSWAEYGASHPIARRSIVFGSCAIVAVTFVWSLYPVFSPLVN